MSRKKFRRIAFIVTALIGLFVISFLLLEYLKLRSFKTALEDLVASKTDGQYKLVIGKSDIDLQELIFQLEDLRIEKSEKNTSEKGVHSVSIPSIRANFGSLKSFFSFGQVTIQELTIAEPVIELDTKKEDHQKQFNIAQTLLKIFPGVESILERFNVQLFRIERGNVKIDRGASQLLNLRFIDFLALNWNMKHLTPDSRIQLSIQGQDVNLNKSKFTFSGVEFKYPEHHLIFKDFSFASNDTLTNSQLNVKGKSIMISHLDYDELYSHQRFKLHKIEIEQPEFTGKLATKKKVDQGKVKYDHPLADILKQTFGEVELDSAIIDDANINVTIAVNDDSIQSTLPRVNMVLSSFKLRADTNQVQVGEINLMINDTEVMVNNDVKLICKQMEMGLHGNFTITDAQFVNTHNSKSFIACERINIENFKVLFFAFEKRFIADTILLENANIDLTPDRIALFPNLSGDTKKKKKRPPPQVGTLMLKNVNVDYKNNAERIHLKNLFLTLDNVHHFSGTIHPHQVSLFKVSSAKATSEKMELELSTGVIDLTGGIADVRNLESKFKTLDIKLDHIRAVPVLASDSIGSKVNHWDHVDLGTLVINGDIPKKDEGLKTNKSSANSNRIKLNRFSIQHIKASVDADENKYSFNAGNLKGNDVVVDKGEVYFQELVGKIYELRTSGNHIAEVDSILIDTQRRTMIYHLAYHGKDVKATIPYLELDKIETHSDNKSIQRFFVRNIKAFSSTGDSLAMIDSLVLHQIHLPKGGRPLISEAEVFRPVINISKQDKKETSGKSSENPMDMVKKINVYEGKLKLKNSQLVIKGNLKADLEKGKEFIQCGEIDLSGEKATINISDIDLRKKNLSISQVSILPNMSYYDNVLEQTDVIQAEFKNVRLSNLSLDSIRQSKKLFTDSIYLGGFSLRVKRDKRLPEPPFAQKPATLDALLQKGKIFTQAIIARKGNIHYEEVALKTGETGKIELHDINATISKAREQNNSLYYTLSADTKLYGQVPVSVNYQTTGPATFNLAIDVEAFDLTMLNQMILPLQAMEIKSGRLANYQMMVTANAQFAGGEAAMTYDDLHLEIFKRSDPEKKNLGSELLTLLADGIILKHNKDNAFATVHQARKPEKSIFNYWVKCAIHGAMNVVRHGKKKKVKPV